MPRYIPPSDSPPAEMATLLLADSGTAGTSKKYKFSDGSLIYLGYTIKQNFSYLLIDNIGDGSIRFSINRPDINMSVPVYGAKTLLSKDSIYLQEDVWGITIYYVEDSSVELVLKRD